MFTKNLFRVCVVLLMAYSSTAFSAELSRSDAQKILGSMGYKDIVVGAVINGVGIGGFGGIGSKNIATVIGYAEISNKPKKLKEILFYDNDFGWFYSETDVETKTVRIWTTTGYKTMQPRP